MSTAIERQENQSERRPEGARDRWRTLAVASTMAAVALAVAWMNRGATGYSSLYANYWRLARFLAGELEGVPVTYPAWGYPWILRVVPHPTVVSVLLQEALAVGSLLFLRNELRCLRVPTWILDLLCIAAVPWYVLASLRLADPWFASLCAFGALVLARALRLDDGWLALLAGLLFGAAANMRSEALGLVPAAALVSFVVAPGRVRQDAGKWAVAACVMLASMLPWGLFRVYHGAPFGLTTTNSGMVLYNALGFHGNAWGIVAADRLRAAEVRAYFGPDVSPTSVEASRWLRDRAIAAIRERPFEYVRKVVHTFTATFRLGFEAIEIEPFLSQEDRLRYEVLKEQLKLLAGARVNPLDVEAFRRAGLWEEDFTLRSVSPRLWAIAALPVANVALSALYLVVLLASTCWLVLVARSRLADPRVRVSVAFVVAIWALLSLLQYEPRQANALYFFGVPAVAIAVSALRARAATARGRARAEA